MYLFIYVFIYLLFYLVYLFIYLFHSYVASKNRDNGKNRRKVTMRLMVRLNLSSDDVINCKKTDPRFGGYTRTFEKS